jgi:exopolysaccharide biosynthesis polyprenyl glycosylphosphotransferase
VTAETVPTAVPQVLPGQRTAKTSSVAVSPLRRPAGRVAAARFTASRLAGVAALVGADVAVMAFAVTVVGASARDAYLLVLTTLALFASAHLYRRRLVPSALDQVPHLVGRALVAGTAVVALDLVTGRSPRVDVLYAAAIIAVLVVLERTVAYALVTHLRRSGALAGRALIVGGGQVAGQLADVLLDHPEYGLLPAGTLDDHPLLPDEDRRVPNLRGEPLARLVREHHVRTVVVAFGSASESSVVDVLRACDRLPCEIYVVPRLYEVLGAGTDVEAVWGIPLVRLRRLAFRTASWRVKRAVDVVFAAVAGVALSPVLLVCAGLVRLETGPKVLFRQQRLGLDGRPFDLLKFRSLRPASETESAERWSVCDDERIGPVGRVLRRTSLDELPQLWNILRGDMSLVGPRPERPHFATEFSKRFPRYPDRHRVPVGLTGWSQVNGLRGDTSIAERARFDNQYIENWSLWLDIKIMLRTVGQVLRCAGR